jgi:hypothetical protein
MSEHVKIHGADRQYVVEINGHQVQNSTESLDLAISATELPRLTLRLHHRFTDLDVRAVVKLDKSTAEALKTIGWTPPGDAD